MSVKVKPQLAWLCVKGGKISQSELSRRTGITQKQLSALEAGKTKAIRFDTLAKLCEFFSYTPNELLELEPEAETKLPTVEELKKADEIIARGLARAIAAPTLPAEEIWAEFDAVRAIIVTNASVKADRKTTAIRD